MDTLTRGGPGAAAIYKGAGWRGELSAVPSITGSALQASPARGTVSSQSCVPGPNPFQLPPPVASKKQSREGGAGGEGGAVDREGGCGLEDAECKRLGLLQAISCPMLPKLGPFALGQQKAARGAVAYCLHCCSRECPHVGPRLAQASVIDPWARRTSTGLGTPLRPRGGCTLLPGPGVASDQVTFEDQQVAALLPAAQGISW